MRWKSFNVKCKKYFADPVSGNPSHYKHGLKQGYDQYVNVGWIIAVQLNKL